MKSFTSYLIASLVVIASCTPQDLQDNTLTSKEKQDGWELLFDGKTMQHWRNFNRDTLVGWMVENGQMVALGEGGDYLHDIITKEQYEHFELYLEWKITPQANSGIFYLAQEMEGVRAIYEIAPEYQIIDDEGWPGGLEDWQKTAANYAMLPPDPEKAKTNPVGDYNSTMIRIKDGHVEHWLNGEMVLEYQMWDAQWDSLRWSEKWKDFPYYGTARKGHIGLQDHGNKIYFKNIKIRRL